MNTDLELIENYVTGQLPPDQRVQFEAALRTDPAVADALTFYMLTKQVAQSQAREQRKAELDALRQNPASPTSETAGTETRTRPLWAFPMRWVAAASVVLLLGLGWYFFRPTNSGVDPAQLADQYVSTHFMQLQTTMDGASSGSSLADSLKLGIDRFNNGKLTEADVVFQDILKSQPNNDSALKYAGIVSLRRGDYDKAITLFHRLSQRTDLYSNPGTFYESLALLKRGRPLDKERAKKLLAEVITSNLGGKSEAQRLIILF